MNTVTGKLFHVSPTKTINELYYVREFILEVALESGNYQHYLKFCLSGGRVNLIDRFKVGDSIQVFFHVTGRLTPAKDNAYNKLSVQSIVKELTTKTQSKCSH